MAAMARLMLYDGVVGVYELQWHAVASTTVGTAVTGAVG
jgi:hypothetical protein